jgi:HD-GYP domain-containing protein (c-di-GMP phosphodiesterase class II)
VTVADIFDALTTTRVYRAALSLEAAYEILEDEVRRGWWDGEVLRELRAAIADLPDGAPNRGIAEGGGSNPTRHRQPPVSTVPL